MFHTIGRTDNFYNFTDTLRTQPYFEFALFSRYEHFSKAVIVALLSKCWSIFEYFKCVKYLILSFLNWNPIF